MQPVSRLCRNSTQRCHLIPRKWNDPTWWHRCRLTSPYQSLYPHRWSFLPELSPTNHRHSQAKNEWSHPNRLPNTKKRCGLSIRSVNRRDVPQCTSNGPYITHPHCQVPPATRKRKSPQVRQQNWRMNCPLFHESETFQILGHEIPLDQVSNKNGPPRSILGTENT